MGKLIFLPFSRTKWAHKFPKKSCIFQNFIETLFFREIQFHLKLCDENNNYSLINSVKEEDIQEESSKEASIKEKSSKEESTEEASAKEEDIQEKSSKEASTKEEDLKEGLSQKEEVKYPWMRPC